MKWIILKASNPKRTKLEADEREDVLSPLKKEGWTMVEGRDAIYKEFLFKDFNEVTKLVLIFNHSESPYLVLWFYTYE